MPKFRKVYINSSHRDAGGTSSKFSITLNQDVDCGPKCHLCVTSVCLPNVFTGINSSNNKLWIYQKHPTVLSSSVNSVIEVAEGNYTATTLSTAILNGLNAAALGSATYSVNYNAVTQKMTITQSGGGGFVVYDSTTLQTLGRIDSTGFYGTLPTIANPQSLQQVLNIPTATDPNTVFVSGIISTIRTQEVFLRSGNITNFGTLDSNGKTDTIKRICLDRPFGEVCVTDSNIETPDLMDCSGKVLRRLDFALTDSYGTILNLHSVDFSFAIAFVFGELD